MASYRLPGLVLGGGLAIAAAGAEAQDSTLTYWTLAFSAGAAGDALDKLEAGFEEQNPGVDVEIVRRGVDEHKSALRIAAGSDRGPDIFYSWAGLGLGGEYVNAGMSRPIGDFYEEYGWEETLLPTSLAFVDQYEGGRHGIPFTFRGMAIYYNKAHFAEAGIETEPQTYEELLDAAQKLEAIGVPAFAFGGVVNWHIMRLMDVILESKCGAEMHDRLKAMEANWAEEPCATESFADMQMWAETYFLSPYMGIDQSQAFNLFAQGRAAMMIEGDWLVTQLVEAEALDDMGLFVAPTGTDRLYGFAEYNYVSSTSDQAELAAKFLDYVVSQEVQQDIVGIFGAVSVNSGVEYSDDLPALQQEWLEFFGSYDQLYGPGDQAFPLDVTTEYWRIINEVASNGMDPAAAAAALQTFIDNNA